MPSVVVSFGGSTAPTTTAIVAALAAAGFPTLVQMQAAFPSLTQIVTALPAGVSSMRQNAQYGLTTMGAGDIVKTTLINAVGPKAYICYSNYITDVNLGTAEKDFFPLVRFSDTTHVEISRNSTTGATVTVAWIVNDPV